MWYLHIYSRFLSPAIDLTCKKVHTLITIQYTHYTKKHVWIDRKRKCPILSTNISRWLFGDWGCWFVAYFFMIPTTIETFIVLDLSGNGLQSLRRVRNVPSKFGVGGGRIQPYFSDPDFGKTRVQNWERSEKLGKIGNFLAALIIILIRF